MRLIGTGSGLGKIIRWNSSALPLGAFHQRRDDRGGNLIFVIYRSVSASGTGLFDNSGVK